LEKFKTLNDGGLSPQELQVGWYAAVRFNGSLPISLLHTRGKSAGRQTKRLNSVRFISDTLIAHYDAVVLPFWVYKQNGGKKKNENRLVW